MNTPTLSQGTTRTATPADPHTTESICTCCGGEIYRTLLEGSGVTRTFWRHEATGYNGCPKSDENATHHGPWCDDEPEIGCDTCRPDSPANWATNADGSLVCPHRDLTVCPTCADHDHVTEVVGAWFFDPTGEIADEVAEVLGR